MFFARPKTNLYNIIYNTVSGWAICSHGPFKKVERARDSKQSTARRPLSGAHHAAEWHAALPLCVCTVRWPGHFDNMHCTPSRPAIYFIDISITIRTFMLRRTSYTCCMHAWMCVRCEVSVCVVYDVPESCSQSVRTLHIKCIVNCSVMLFASLTTGHHRHIYSSAGHIGCHCLEHCYCCCCRCRFSSDSPGALMLRPMGDTHE